MKGAVQKHGEILDMSLYGCLFLFLVLVRVQVPVEYYTIYPPDEQANLKTINVIGRKPKAVVIAVVALGYPLSPSLSLEK